MNVLSLFDGMSCGQIALNRIGLKPKNYFASEVDKHAIKVTQENYPDTIQLGDVRNINVSQLPKIDILIGGSPCQSFSFAGKREGMTTTENVEILSLQQYEEMKAEGFEFKGQSYLFWEYVRILKEVKPKYFFLENVRMSAKWRNLISEVLGVQPVLLNSALVSAQSRNRLYWFNIPGYKAPKDKEINILDVVKPSFVDTPEWLLKVWDGRTRLQRIRDVKTLKSNAVIRSMGGLMGYIKSENKVYKLTPEDCERLQTVPEGYTASVSNTQRLQMLGNGWTVDAVAHIFKGLKLDQQPKKFFKTTLF